MIGAHILRLSGSLSPETNEQWSYFELESHFSRNGDSIKETIAHKRDPRNNFESFKTIDSQIYEAGDLNLQGLPNQEDYNIYKAPSVSIGRETSEEGYQFYHQIRSYYAQAALKEFHAFRNHTISRLIHNNKNVKFYYDHLPITFLGYGSAPKKVIQTFPRQARVSSFCENGCQNLVITSHETCAALENIDPYTEHVCLPKKYKHKNN